MIEIQDGLYVAAEHVTFIKEVDEKSCSVWVVGQSATDGGFLIPKSALEMATDVLEAKKEWEEWKASLLMGDGDDEEPEDEDDGG